MGVISKLLLPSVLKDSRSSNQASVVAESLSCLDLKMPGMGLTEMSEIYFYRFSPSD